MTFQAWDRTSGIAGGTGDATVNGGTTAFSTASASSGILVNDAPTLSGANNLASIRENSGANAGTLVSALIAGKTNDVNGDSVGIAVAAADNTSGTWEYTTDSGAHWTAFGSPSTTAARLLTADANTLVRFTPNTNFHGTASLSFQAWDQTSGTAGGTADVTSSGGTTAFSSTSASAMVNVLAQPTISGTAGGQTTFDGTPIDPFVNVTIGDASTSNPSLTVTVTLDAAANGQFSTDRQAAGQKTSPGEFIPSPVRRRPRPPRSTRWCSCRRITKRRPATPC